MAGSAWAVNAVIVKDDGQSVTYHTRCPNCGDVNVGQTRSCGGVIPGMIVNQYGMVCTKCGKSFDIQFRRG